MRRFAALIFASVLIFVLVFPYAAMAALVDYQIYSGAGVDNSGRHAIVQDSEGTIWAAYRAKDGSSIDQIFVSYSDDGGETWTQEQVTSSADDQTYVSLAIDSQDHLHLVWMGLTWGANPTFWQILHCERTPGVGWGSVELVTDVAESQRTADIATDSNDDLHVVWYGKSWGANPTINNLRYRKKESGVWQSHEAITDIGVYNQDRACLYVDSGNDLHVSWHGAGWGVNTTIINVQYRIRSAAGSWGAQENVTDLTAHQSYPAFVLDSVDDTYMVWMGTGWGSNPTKRQVAYNKRTSGSWGTAGELTDTWDDQQPTPTISVDQQGIIHLVWTGESWGTYPARRQLSYLRYDGSWGGQALLTDNDYNSVGAVLALGVYDGYLFSYNTATDLRFMGDWEEPPASDPLEDGILLGILVVGIISVIAIGSDLIRQNTVRGSIEVVVLSIVVVITFVVANEIFS